MDPTVGGNQKSGDHPLGWCQNLVNNGISWFSRRISEPPTVSPHRFYYQTHVGGVAIGHAGRFSGMVLKIP